MLSLHVQSVLNAAARSVAGLRRSDHNTNTLASFHWLRAPEHIQFKLSTLIYKSLHGLAPKYLVDDLRYRHSRQTTTRSASSFQLEVSRTRLVTVGGRTFSAAGSRLWNSLPRDFISLDIDCFSYVDLEVFYLDHAKMYIIYTTIQSTA